MAVSRVVVTFVDGRELAMADGPAGPVIEGGPPDREGWRAVRCVLDLFLGEPGAPRRERGPSARLPNRGKPWSADQETEVLARFDAGEEPGTVAKAVGRSVGAVRARLARHGRIPADGLRYPLR